MWVCCQLGAREHYSVPRALSLRGELGLLVTDAWTSPGNIGGTAFGARLRDRHHVQLREANVAASTASYCLSELRRRFRREGWDRLVARNEWFQRTALRALHTYRRHQGDRHTVLFAYSYAAHRLLRFAKDSGWDTVLGQIDGGPVEEKIEMELRGKFDTFSLPWNPAPPEYWRNWERECALADRIVVNSRWSQRCIAGAGIAADKLIAIPLAYEPPARAAGFERQYPAAFSEERPLRILFLGQVNLRKGVHAILDALPALTGKPVEFRMVGPLQMNLPHEVRSHPRIQWAGPIPRAESAAEYRRADLFLFPTNSDGFGITQLEAQAWKLPIVTSEFCGEVVRHLDNGYVLPNVSGPAIVTAIEWLLADPRRLTKLSAQSGLSSCFSVEQLGTRLTGIPASMRNRESTSYA